MIVYRPRVMRLASLLAALVIACSGVVAVSAPAWAVDYDCSDFSTQEEAQQYLLPGDPHRLDADGDGQACDSLPSGGGGGGGGTAPRSKATVTIKIARKPVAAHRWRFTCTVKRSGKAYVGKNVTFLWHDNGGPWYRWPKPVKTNRKGQASLVTEWPPPAGEVRCRTAATSKTKAGQSRTIKAWPR